MILPAVRQNAGEPVLHGRCKTAPLRCCGEYRREANDATNKRLKVVSACPEDGNGMDSNTRQDSQLCMSRGEDLYMNGRYDDAISAYGTGVRLKYQKQLPTLQNRKDVVDSLDSLTSMRHIIFREHFSVDRPRLGSEPTLSTHADDSRPFTVFECVNRIDPVFSIEPTNKSLIFAAHGKFHEALKEFDRIESIDHKNIDVCVKKGAILASLGRHKDALVELDRALELDSGNIVAHIGRGDTLLQLDRTIDALAAFDRAIHIRPDNSDAHLCRGRALHSLGRYGEALIAMDSAIGLDPDSVDAYIGRGHALLGLGRYDEARLALNHALELDPDSADAHLGHGHALLELGHYAAALKDLDRALALDSDNACTHICRGYALRSLGRYDEALEELDLAAAMAPTLKVPPISK